VILRMPAFAALIAFVGWLFMISSKQVYRGFPVIPVKYEFPAPFRRIHTIVAGTLALLTYASVLLIQELVGRNK